MRAIKIDPFTETITEMDIPAETGDIGAVYKEIPGARAMSFIYAIPNHFLMVDDEGLLNDNKHKLFVHRLYHQPLAGVGIIMGKVGPEGNLGPAKIKLSDVQRDVIFVSDTLEFVGMKHEEGTTEHPVFGETFTISSIPVFKFKKEEEDDERN